MRPHNTKVFQIHPKGLAMRYNLVVTTVPRDVSYFVDVGPVNVFLSCTNAAAHNRPSNVVRCCCRKFASGCSSSRAYPTSGCAAFKPSKTRQEMHRQVVSMVNMCRYIYTKVYTVDVLRGFAFAACYRVIFCPSNGCQINIQKGRLGAHLQ